MLDFGIRDAAVAPGRPLVGDLSSLSRGPSRAEWTTGVLVRGEAADARKLGSWGDTQWATHESAATTPMRLVAAAPRPGLPSAPPPHSAPMPSAPPSPARGAAVPPGLSRSVRSSRAPGAGRSPRRTAWSSPSAPAQRVKVIVRGTATDKRRLDFKKSFQGFMPRY